MGDDKNESTPQKKDALDARWFERFRRIAAFQDYEYLNGDKEYRKGQKRKFLAGEINNPELDYPALENFDWEQKEGELISLRRDILEQEQNNVVRQTYGWRLNEKIAEVRMLKAAKRGDDAGFVKSSMLIYGKPEEAIYQYTLGQIKEVIEQGQKSADLQICAAAKRLHEEIMGRVMHSKMPGSIAGYVGMAAKPTTGEREFSAREIKQAFRDYLSKHNIQGWEIVSEVSSATAINVNQRKKQVNIPETRKIKKTQLKALMEHELGIHVLRREMGERSQLKLLGLGLDKYLKGEEGIARYEEQLIQGATNFAGLVGYLAISLAVGMDGKKRDFRAVFEILKDYYFISSKKEKSAALKSAKNIAWTRCVRTFRGTTCKTPGACFTRDIVYRAGNIGIWSIVQNNPEEMKRFSVGKYDPTNPRHIWVLEQLGITDGDLAELEK